MVCGRNKKLRVGKNSAPILSRGPKFTKFLDDVGMTPCTVQPPMPFPLFHLENIRHEVPKLSKTEQM